MAFVYNTLPRHSACLQPGRLRLAPLLTSVRHRQNGPFCTKKKKKKQKPAQKPDGQTHSVVTNSEENEDEAADHENETEDTGEGTSRQTRTAGVPSKKTKGTNHTRWAEKISGKWTDLFCMARTPLCLLCRQTRAGLKRSNLERHYKTAHPKFNESYPPGSELRKKKMAQFTAFTLGAAKSYPPDNLQCRVFNRSILWNNVDFGTGKKKNFSQTQKW